MNSARQHYLQVLHSLDPLAQYNDLHERMKLLCPHLAPEEIGGILDTWGTVAFALPPVKVNGSFLTASFTNDTRGTFISLTPPGTITDEYTYTAQAITYANLHWPEHLLDDTWTDVQKVTLANPIRLDKYGKPGHIATIYVALNYSWLDLCVHGQPTVQTWDTAITFATTNWVEGNELTGKHPSVALFSNCAHCGGGLGINQCNGCGIDYNAIHNGWNMPLAPKLVTLLEDEGCQFALHPSHLY